MSDNLPGFLAARYAESWQQARDRELAAGLDISRATRDIDAKQKTLALHAGQHECPGNDGYAWYGDDEAPWCPTLRLAAAVYDDHPDYRGESEKWKP